jgi:hypothetical protein
LRVSGRRPACRPDWGGPGISPRSGAPDQQLREYTDLDQAFELIERALADEVFREGGLDPDQYRAILDDLYASARAPYVLLPRSCKRLTIARLCRDPGMSLP